MNQDGEFIHNICLWQTSMALKLFCKEVNNSDADIIVIMAQKAVKIFYILIEQGLIDEEVMSKDIFCHTAIPYDSTIFLNKKVAIIDDIIISGSSIAVTANKLISAGVSQDNIEIFALATDSYYYTMTFTNSLGKDMLICNLRLEDDDCIELSYDLAKILRYYGKFYDTDFPIYNEFELWDNNYSYLFNSLLCDTIDMSDSMDNSRFKVFEIFPKKQLRNCIWKKLKNDFDDMAYLKMRIIIHQYSNGDCSANIIPMVCFNEMHISNVEQLFESVFSHKFFENTLEKGWKIKEKFRLLQYYISHIFAEEYINAMGLGKYIKLNIENVNMQFGKKFGEQIRYEIENRKMKKLKLNIKYIKPNVLNYESTLKKLGEQDEYEENNCIINESMLKPFIFWYKNEELPARQKLKKSYNFISDIKEIEKYTKRLDMGFSLRVLSDILNQSENYPITKQVLSAFIDRAVDKGIIVPINYYNEDDNYICRGYRHGEDLPFGLADKCRCLYFLLALNKIIKSLGIEDGIATITMEKLIVLFYQIGLKDGGIFNRFLGFDNIPIIKERFSVHGAIRTETDKLDPQPHIYHESKKDNESTWITRWLRDEENKFIELTTEENSKHYVINSYNIEQWLKYNQMSCISKNVERKIDKIAHILGILYVKNVNRKDSFKHDVIALTSCVDIYSFSSSIATVLHYFKIYWDRRAEICINSIVKLENDYNYGFQYDNTSQTLYNGQKKHKWYRENRGKNFIKEGSEILCGYYDYKIYWDSIWQSTVRAEAGGDKLGRLVYRGLEYLYFYSACYDWLTWNYGKDISDKEKHIDDFKKYYSEYSTCKSKYSINPNDPYNSRDLFDIFCYLQSEDNEILRVEGFKQCVKECLEDSEALIDDIEEEISSNSDTYTIYYQSCFIVDILPLENCDCDNLFMRFWTEKVDEDTKLIINIISFGETKDKYSRYGVFFDKKGVENNDTLIIDTYHQLCREFSIRTYKVRTIFIPFIPSRYTFEHNLQKNIKVNVNKMENKLIFKLENLFLEDKFEQLLFIETRFTDKKYIEQVNAINWKQKELEIEILGISKVKLYYKELPNIVSNDSVADNSTILICDGESRIGTGFLIHVNGRIFVISCQHIFHDKNFENLNASIKIDNRKFNIRLLNYNKNANFALEEIAFLEPLWEETIWLDAHRIFNTENVKDISKYAGEHNIKCFGYSNEHGNWLNDLKPVGLVDEGFFQLDSVMGASSGFSGAPIVSEDGGLFGMHVKHSDEHMYMIQAKDIIKKIESEEFI